MIRLAQLARDYQGGIAAVLFFASVFAGLELVARTPTTQGPVREPAGFSLSPEGEDVPRLAPIKVTFASEPSDRTPERLLAIEPAARGTYAWLSPRTLLFQPDVPGLLRGSTYTVRVSPRPEAGVPAEIVRNFRVSGVLSVQQVIPGDGDTEVPLAAPILIQFSRSVAPLTTLSAQRADQIVTFDPPLNGKGEWLNTSIYRFVPSDLRPSTTYRVRIAKGLTGAADGVLPEDHASTFTTVLPAVAELGPADNTQHVGPRDPVKITFNQPMDHASAEGITVRAGDTPIVGKIAWSERDTIATFTPSAPLAPATRHTVTIAKGLRGAAGGTTATERVGTFTTISLPWVRHTEPQNGATTANHFGVRLEFATPMDPDSLEGKLSISGFTAADLEGRVHADERTVYANVQLRPRTSYTVSLAPGATDRYGQVMGGHGFSFTTAPLASTVSLALPGYGSAATYSSTAEPRLFFRVTNMASVGFTLYPLTPEEGRNAIHDPSLFHRPPGFTPSLPALRTWTQPVADAEDQSVVASTSLTGGGALPKGYYFVHTNGNMRSMFAFAVIDTVIVTKLSTHELLAWALDHDTGRPLQGVNLRTFGPGIAPQDRPTDANGLASFSVPVPELGKNMGDRSYLLWLDGARTAVSSTRWENGITPYQLGISAEHFARTWVGHLYTDRPIYRPGETAELKGVIRADDDARYSVRRDGSFALRIHNARGQEVLSQDVTLNDFGSFAARFELPKDAPLGDYRANLELKGGQHPIGIAGNSFLVAEFRNPEFQVEVTTGRPFYVSGDRIDVRVASTFFFGGALAGAEVSWSALAEAEPLRVEGFERYSFSEHDFAFSADHRDPLRASGTATTGADGVARYEVAAALQAREGTQRFTLAATVKDVNGQAVASSASALVHPAARYVGLRPARYVATAGQPATIELVTVDSEGAIAGGESVTVRVYDRQWITVKEQVPDGGRRYRSEPKDTLLQTLSTRTAGDGTGTVTARPVTPGTLWIVAEVTDRDGRTGRSATYLWVAGTGLATWHMSNDDTMKLVADKDRYEVGDTAEILVPSPFAGATALVTVERGKIITRSVRHMATNSERLSIAIEDGSVPNVFVSVVLYRGPTQADPIPRFKVGYAQLAVSTKTRALNVVMTPERPQAEPGDTVRYDIAVTDHTGKGVKAELSVAVVDKEVLSLQEERGPNGMLAFWFERGLGVQTASSMTTSVDRWNDVVVEAARAGKGGSGLRGDRARQDFRNTAYWNAHVLTGEDGRASIQVTLPDSLTTWRGQVRAISGDTLVGEGTSELLATQPLLVRSALPRFLRVGDSVDLRMLVRNATAEPTDVRVALDADGVEISGGLTRSATIRPGESADLVWPAKATAEGRARLDFTATGTGGLSDRLIQELPVALDVTPETMATGGVVSGEDVLEAVYLPPFAITKHGSLSVQVRSTLVGSLAGELRHLDPLAREGAERVASRLIASLGVRRAERSGGAATTISDERIASDLAGLVGRQRPDGGWAWCDEAYCASDPNITGWALFALGEARRNGLSYDLGVVGRASNYVMTHVGRVTDVVSPADPSHKAFLLASLSSAGAGDLALGPARALFEQQRAQLGAAGQAYLVTALADAGVEADDLQLRALLNDLATGTIPSANGNHWEVGDRRGALVTNNGATALGTLALARVQPRHALLPQTVRWLVLARSTGWETNIDRALSVLALTTFSVGTGELAGEYDYNVYLDDREVLAGEMTRSDQPGSGEAKVPLTELEPGKSSILALTREQDAPGRMYYTMDLRYVTPAQQIDAVNRGLAISREYTLLADPDAPVTSASLGETVRVKLTVLVPADRKYVVVEDLLPAGLEPVDMRLRTVDPALREQLEKDRLAAAERKAGGYAAPWLHWYYSPWQQVDLRDDRAVLVTDSLPKGVYEYVYYARATSTGDFFVAPAHAEETYFPEVFGRSDSSRFTVVR